MLYHVVQLLKSMGLSVEEDDPMLLLTYDAATERLLNFINDTVVPEGLRTALIYLTAAQYLQYAKGAGRLVDAEGNAVVDFSTVVKSISEGDASVTYAVGASEGTSTQEQRLDAFISWLTAYAKNSAFRYRKLVW